MSASVKLNSENYVFQIIKDDGTNENIACVMDHILELRDISSLKTNNNNGTKCLFIFPF